MLALLLGVLHISGVSASDQNEKDSIRDVLLNAATETDRVDALNALSLFFYNSGENDSSLFYAGKAMSLSQSLGYQKGLAISNNRMGNVLFQNHSYDKAFGYFDASLSIATDLDDSKLLSDAFNNLGLISFRKGNYPEAQEYLMEAIRLLESLSDHEGVARSYNNLGNVYFQSGDHGEAQKCYEKALDTQQAIGDSLGVGRSLNNIGGLILMQGKYEEALQKFEHAVRLKRKIGDYQSIGRSFINIGNVYYHQSYEPGLSKLESDRLFGESIRYFKKALSVADSIGDIQSAATTNNNIGAIYIARNEFDKGREHLKKGLALAIEVRSKHDIMASYSTLSIADTMQGKWKDAYYHSQKYLLYHDSIVNDANAKKILQTQLAFEFDRREAELEAEQQVIDAAHVEQLKLERLKGWTLTLGVGAMLLIILLLLNRWRLKQKQRYQRRMLDQQERQAKALIEIQEIERKRVAEDLHDSLGHLLSTAKFQLQQGEESSVSPNVVQLLDQASGELRNIAYNLMPQVLERDGLLPALSELADKLKRLNQPEVSLHLHNLEGLPLDLEQQFVIYRIIQESLHNVIKHADAQCVNLQFVGHEDHLTIMIEDNGKGFDPKSSTKGRGLNNIKTRTEWLKGTFSLDSSPGNGTTMTIEIPVTRK